MPYPSDVTNKQWSLIASYFELKRNFGRPLTHSRREIVNAIFYMTKAGCQWRMLPHEFPCWSTVYYYFQKWNKEGIWEK